MSSVNCLKIAFLYTRPIRLAPLVAYTLANLASGRENMRDSKPVLRTDQITGACSAGKQFPGTHLMAGGIKAQEYIRTGLAGTKTLSVQ